MNEFFSEFDRQLSSEKFGINTIIEKWLQEQIAYKFIKSNIRKRLFYRPCIPNHFSIMLFVPDNSELDSLTDFKKN